MRCSPSLSSTRIRFCHVTNRIVPKAGPHSSLDCAQQRRRVIRSLARPAATSENADACSTLREENSVLRERLRTMVLDDPELQEHLAPFLEKHEALATIGRGVGEVIPSILDQDEVDVDEGTASDVPKPFSPGVEVQVEEDDAILFRFQSTPISNNAVSSSMSSSLPKKGAELSGSGEGPVTKASGKAEAVQMNSSKARIDRANAEVAAHDPAKVLDGKEDWLFVTVPSQLTAGAKAVLYYNKARSQILQHRPHVQLHAKCNDWELDMGDSDRIDMTAPGIQGPGIDLVRAELDVPVDAYELNFIFSDKEDTYDNNETNNYCLPVSGDMTKQKWIDTAPERAEAEYLKRKEEERIAAEIAAKEAEERALEGDERDAYAIVGDIKSRYGALTAGAVTSIDRGEGQPAVTVEQKTVRGSVQLKILYNRKATNLADVDTSEHPPMVRIGHNDWKNPTDFSMKPTKAKKSVALDETEWWETSIKVPVDAVALNMVFFCNDVFDNNSENDYCILVDRGTDVDSWADSIVQPLKKEITAARHAKEEAARKLEEERAKARQAVRDKAEQVRRLQLKHVLFTKPEVPVAGRDVTIYYNPNNTVLNGSADVCLTLGYNRWRHPRAAEPMEMKKSTSGDHYEATVDVPKDAYALDFVFSNSDGQYDNRGGLDYNVAVQGSVVEEPPLYAVHIAVEMAPIAKVGGMGDVVTALGRAVMDLGHNVEVILPRYDFFLQSPLLGATQYETEFEWGGTRIFVSTCIVEGIRCWFIEPGNGMFSGDTVYRGNEDAGRFEFFSNAALEFLLRTQRQPDIIHCHDWSSATVAKSYWTHYHEQGLWKSSVVFTIHNLNYGADLIGEAAYYSQRFTTVSPTYAWEIGGNPAIAANNAKLTGIRNGIDVDIWNPETDQFLPLSYTAASCEAGKAAAREALRQRLGLSGWGDKPLVGVVTRLTKQKGTHLIAHSCWRTLDRGGQFVLLGSAPDPKVQAEFDGLAQMHAGENAAFCFAFDEPLSHLIYAACDMILVPSMFEPCGLTQMIAMRYGAVPVVRATGGLKDTVFDVDTDKARAAWELEGSTDWEADKIDATNGFSFEGTDEGAMDYALNRAFDAYYNDREWFRSLQQRVMAQDWSWNKPAIDYIQLYYAALKK